MLARRNLIPLRKEFSRIRKTAKNYDSPSFGLLVSYGSTNPQAAFIVSKKISRSSVVRHEVKRKLADAVTSFLPRLAKNIQLVFLARPKVVESSGDELKKEVESILHRARLLQ